MGYVTWIDWQMESEWIYKPKLHSHPVCTILHYDFSVNSNIWFIMTIICEHTQFKTICHSLQSISAKRALAKRLYLHMIYALAHKICIWDNNKVSVLISNQSWNWIKLISKPFIVLQTSVMLRYKNDLT